MRDQLLVSPSLVSGVTRGRAPRSLLSSFLPCQSVHKVVVLSRRMAERLATVPEETTDGFTAASPPPRSPYRDRIRMVAVSGEQIRSTLFSNSQSSHNGSSYSSDSGASNSYPFNYSGGSSGSAASAAAPNLGAHELKMIAHQMVNDGYTERMVQAFNAAASPPTAACEYGGGQDRAALGDWFSELDVDWVLQIREGHGLQLQDRSLQDLVEKWIRALTVIVVSIRSLAAPHRTLEVAHFGKTSIAEMVVFTDAVVPALKAENLQAVLDMYICVSNTSSDMFMIGIPFMPFEIGSLLARAGTRLSNAISNTMEKVRTLVEDDDLWAIEIPRGGGEVHTNTRFMVDCIVSMRKAQASTENSAPSYHTGNLRELINATVKYQMDLLLRKSLLCSDPSLRLRSSGRFQSRVSGTCCGKV
nr:uncharacterized protein LOC127336666 isoform X2 [Lolium perenne]